MNSTLKILQLNKGNSKFKNRSDQINEILSEHKPHVFIINELNIKSNDNLSKNMFPNYNMEIDNLEISDLKSRTGILIHSDINYKRRRDLETQGTSTVWVQLTHPSRKPLLIQAIYRQFQRLGKANSDSAGAQYTRWEKIISKWKLAMEEKREILVLGDLNLNTMRWETPLESMTSYEKLQKPMVDILREEILNKGFKILNGEPTRLKDTPDSKPACLDLLMTNVVEKIASFQTGIPAFSDHTLQILTRKTKGISKKQKFIRMRSFVNFNCQEYKNNILDHYLYIETNYEQEPNKIAQNIQTIIQDSLEILAPVKVVQLKPQKNRILSTKAKEALVQRDLAFMEFKKTNKQEDLRFYRNLKNSTNNLISKEKFQRKVNLFQNESESTNDKWKNLKKRNWPNEVYHPPAN